MKRELTKWEKMVDAGANCRDLEDLEPYSSCAVSVVMLV